MHLAHLPERGRVQDDPGEAAAKDAVHHPSAGKAEMSAGPTSHIWRIVESYLQVVQQIDQNGQQQTFAVNCHVTVD